jgi:phosphoglycerate dehydrogenase-like enzyme
MKKGSIFINVSRGKIVKTDDLIKNSVYKKFRGIGLDVTDPEPLERNSLLRKLDNVFITPHVAGPSDNNRKRGFDLIKENIRRFISNDSLLNVVDKKKEY